MKGVQPRTYPSVQYVRAPDGAPRSGTSGAIALVVASGAVVGGCIAAEAKPGSAVALWVGAALGGASSFLSLVRKELRSA